MAISLEIDASNEEDYTFEVSHHVSNQSSHLHIALAPFACDAESS